MKFDLERKLFSRYPLLANGKTAGDGFVDESENDDLNDDDDDIKEAVMTEEDDEEEEEEGKSEDQEEEPEGKEDEPETPKAKLPKTQEELDELIEKRLLRERRRFEGQIEEIKAQYQRQSQAESEKKQQEEWDRYTKQVYDLKYNQLVGAGYDEGLARVIAENTVQQEIMRVQLQQEQQARAEQEKRINAMIKYSQQKSNYLSKHPLVAKYVEEIDAASRNGEIADFETAARYVLGQKVISGEIQNAVKTATEQKTLKNIEARKKVTAENAGLPGKSETQETLTKEERKFARIMGITDAEYLANKPKKVIRKKR